MLTEKNYKIITDRDFFQTINYVRIYYQQTHTIRNVKGNLSDRSKIISDENMDLYNRKVNYVGKYLSYFIII